MQGLLESWTHKVITRAALCENGKVDPKPEKINDSRYDDKSQRTSGKVLGDMFLLSSDR